LTHATWQIGAPGEQVESLVANTTGRRLPEAAARNLQRVRRDSFYTPKVVPIHSERPISRVDTKQAILEYFELKNNRTCRHSVSRNISPMALAARVA